jgi:hypothetical protein
MGRPYEETDSSTLIASTLFPVRGWIATDGRHNIPYLTGWMFGFHDAPPFTPAPLRSTLVTSWGKQGEPTQKEVMKADTPE